MNNTGMLDENKGITLSHSNDISQNGSILESGISSTSVFVESTASMVISCVFEQPPLTDVRFWIVTVFGTGVSLISIIENGFFFYLFSTRKHHRTTYNMYMMFLTFFDFFVSGAYVLLMFHYMVPILTVSHCGISSSCFLILAATFERYCLTLKSSWVRFVQHKRKLIILCAILLGIISKGTICIEFKISYVEECAGTMTEYQLQFAEFVYGTSYHTVWRFWYRNIVTVFFPFFALLALNMRIIRALTRAERQSLSFPNANSKQFKRKKVARSATRTTVLVVCTYLISNVINVVLTTWEHIDNTLLITDLVQAYAIALDLASLLTNIASALRPPIYLICQPTLRQEVFTFLKCFLDCNSGKPVTRYNSYTVADIIYTKITDDNSHNNTNDETDKIDLAAVMPNCAALVAAAVNTTEPKDYTAMDLMKDEEDFFEDAIKEEGLDLVDFNNGKLESIAARIRFQRQSQTANSRIASMIVPSYVNATPCLSHTLCKVNGIELSENGQSSALILNNEKNDCKNNEGRSRSVDPKETSAKNSEKFLYKPSALSSNNETQKNLTILLSNSFNIISASLPTTPVLFKCEEAQQNNKK